MTKTRLFILIPIVVAFSISGLAFVFWGTFASIKDSAENKARMNQIFAQENILKIGDHLVEKGFYDEALKKYDEALAASYISDEADKASPLFRKVRLFRLLGQYKRAQDQLDMFLKLSSSGNKPEIAFELEALNVSQKTNSAQPILDYIARLTAEKKNQLPPMDYSVASAIYISTILRLYDTIGDHDAAIAYIDEILGFLRERRKTEGNKDYEIYDRVRTIEQTAQCMKAGPKDNPDWHGCKFLREYLLVRAAFERDKAEGTKGRATRALIQSDYFPW